MAQGRGGVARTIPEKLRQPLCSFQQDSDGNAGCGIVAIMLDPVRNATAYLGGKLTVIFVEFVQDLPAC